MSKKSRSDPTLGKSFQPFSMFWWDNIPAEGIHKRDGGYELSHRRKAFITVCLHSCTLSVTVVNSTVISHLFTFINLIILLLTFDLCVLFG